MTLNFLFLKLPSSFWTSNLPHAHHSVVPWMNQMTFSQQVHSFPISPKCSFSPTEHRSSPLNWQHPSLPPPQPPGPEVLGHSFMDICVIRPQSLSDFPIRCLSALFSQLTPAPQQELSYYSNSSPCLQSCPCILFPDCQQSDCCSDLNPLGFLIMHDRAAQWETTSLKSRAGVGLVKLQHSGPALGQRNLNFGGKESR